MILAVGVSWFICFVLTLTNAVPNDEHHWAYYTRTDSKSYVLEDADWIHIPYPCTYKYSTISGIYWSSRMVNQTVYDFYSVCDFASVFHKRLIITSSTLHTLALIFCCLSVLSVIKLLVLS